MKPFNLSRFDQIDKTVIDASSIIYMKKAGFFDRLAATTQLLTLDVIIHEVYEPTPGIEVFQSTHADLSNDRALIDLARIKAIPIISEDKQLLQHAERIHLDYYNSLMMLLFLLYKEKLDENEYLSMYTHLMKIARYADAVIQYGDQVYRMIRNTEVT